MFYVFPSEGDDPYFDTFRSFANELDAADYGLSDDKNLIATGTAAFTWDAGSGLLEWSDDFYFSGYTTGFHVRIQGPSSQTIQNGQILAFVMPRLLTADADVVPYVATRIAESDDIKIHDRTVICIRRDDTIYFRNGVTLSDGESGPIWERPIATGGGITPSQRAAINAVLHEHIEYIFDRTAIPPAYGLVVNGQQLFTLPDPSPEVYRRFSVYKNGVRLQKAGDYTESLVTWQVQLVTAISPLDRHLVIVADKSKTVPI